MYILKIIDQKILNYEQKHYFLNKNQFLELNFIN
jgi:hypothetical protein